MSIGETMKDILGQGAEKSKQLASKAGAKAQNMGEQTVLMLDIKKLKGLLEKQLDSLGREVYQAFAIEKVESVKVSDIKIAKILNDIASLKANILEKEAELQVKKEA